MVPPPLHVLFQIHVDKHLAANEFSRYRAGPSDRRLNFHFVRQLHLHEFNITSWFNRYFYTETIEEAICTFRPLRVMLNYTNKWRNVNIVKKKPSRFTFLLTLYSTLNLPPVTFSIILIVIFDVPKAAVFG